jgi:hypothetical protein
MNEVWRRLAKWCRGPERSSQRWDGTPAASSAWPTAIGRLAHITLVVMTVVAAIFTPLVVADQSWSYWVFRRRLTRPAQGPEEPGPEPSTGAEPAPRGA